MAVSTQAKLELLDSQVLAVGMYRSGGPDHDGPQLVPWEWDEKEMPRCKFQTVDWLKTDWELSDNWRHPKGR